MPSSRDINYFSVVRVAKVCACDSTGSKPYLASNLSSLRRADPSNACGEQMMPPPRLNFKYHNIYSPWRTYIWRIDCTAFSLKHQSAAIAITPVLTLPFASLVYFQSDKIGDCQNMIKFKWDGIHFYWKVSVEISMKSDLTRIWESWHEKNKGTGKKIGPPTTGRRFHFGFCLFIRTHERVNRIRNPCWSGTVQ